MPSLTRRTALGCFAGIPFLNLTEFRAILSATPPTDETIREILVQRIDAERQSRGIVVGLVAPTGTRILAHGAYSAVDPRVPDEDTLFDVGSITKIFTAILLADAVRRGEMHWDDSLARHLPLGISIPQLNGKSITLLDLATHTSGLPVLPDDFPGEADPDGRSQYSSSQLYAFLSRYQLPAKPGTRWLYSNLGYALIAMALSHRTRLTFEVLLQSRIAHPLGLTDTAITLSASQLARLAPGHDLSLSLTPREHVSVMVGAEGLYSTTRDLCVLVHAFLGFHRTTLSPALTEMLRVRRPIEAYGGVQAIGPQVFGEGDAAQVSQSGSTPGYASSIAWVPGRFGVVVLSNSAPPVLDISAHLLDPNQPLAAPMHVLVVDPMTLGRFVGRYRAENGMIFAITQGERGLAFEAIGGSPKIDMVPEGAAIFTVPRVRARIAFEGTAPSPAQSIRVDFAGMVYTGVRVPD